MAKIKIAEIFHSLQGEGLWVGVPSVFVRTFGCNFECRGFGLSDGKLSTEPEEFAAQFKENPDWEYTSLPLAKTGCDSYASWHKGFKKLSPMMDIKSITTGMEIDRIADSGMPVNDGSTHLVITGGEPLLGWQRAYPELFDAVYKDGYKHITFETNGTQKITDDFEDYLLLQQIKSAKAGRSLTFSVSPKISSSGEAMEDALKPDVVASYQKYGKVYLKFVVAKESDMRDVVHFIDAYRDAGWDGNLNAPEVAKLAMLHGFRYSPRLQVDLWKNEWGT